MYLNPIELHIWYQISFLQHDVRGYPTRNWRENHLKYNQGPRKGDLCPPPPIFLKVKKVPFFLGLNAPIKERKKYFLNKRPLFLERKCPFRSSKDSVKAISNVIETPYFKK
jgi:hypothetical protein